MPQQQQTPNWLPYAGFALAIAGMIYQGGVLSGNVSENSRRIDKLEAKYTSQWDAVQQINIRGVQNQSKLDFLVEQAQKKDHRQ